MRFSSHLSSHLTPEWKKHYIDYDSLKKIVYSMVGHSPVEELDDAGVPGEGTGSCLDERKCSHYRNYKELQRCYGDGMVSALATPSVSM